MKNVDELLAELEMLGYTVRRGKYISVKAPDQQRAVRLKTLGDDYTVESLASRILWKDGSGGTLFGGQPFEMSERYTATIYAVKQGRANACRETSSENAQEHVDEQQYCKPLRLRVSQIRHCRHKTKSCTPQRKLREVQAAL